MSSSPSSQSSSSSEQNIVPSATSTATLSPPSEEALTRLKLYFRQQRLQQQHQESQVGMPESDLNDRAGQTISGVGTDSVNRTVTPLQAFDSLLQYLQSIR